MTLKLITQEHSFEEPGTLTNQTIDVGGAIYDGKATIVLVAFDAEFSDEKDHHLKKVTAKIKNIKVKEASIDYDLEFNFKDDSDHLGKGRITILAVADVN